MAAWATPPLATRFLTSRQRVQPAFATNQDKLNHSFSLVQKQKRKTPWTPSLPLPPPPKQRWPFDKDWFLWSGFHRGWRQLLGEGATSMEPVHHDDADWTLEDARHWSKHNILMLLLYLWPLCGSGVDFRPRTQEEVRRCNTAAAIVMSSSLCWHGKMGERLREGPGRSEVQQRPRESITLHWTQRRCPWWCNC